MQTYSKFRVYNIVRVLCSTAVPSLDFPEHESEHELVPASGTVSTEFDCAIQPGAAPESYSITWFQLNPDGGFTRIMEGINLETFSLTLQVNLSHNNTVYQCRVDIDHDGTGNLMQYNGAEITLYTAGKAACAPYHCSVCTDSDSPATQWEPP